MTQPFAGIRVIDFSQVLAGPFATQQLAQHGAEVIKLEPPGTGDMTRGQQAGQPPQPGTPSFLTCNLGKKSITLNLKGAAAGQVLPALIKTADVIVQNFRPGVMQRLGYDYPAVAALRPDIVYCSISGFGQSGPASHLPAFDGAIQAASGMMAITGHPETGPTRTGYMPVDMATSLNAAFAIAAALFRRQATGAGQHIDVAMMDTAMVLQAPQVSAYLVNGLEPELFGNRSPTKAPTANVFTVADGHVQVVALKEPQVEAFFGVLGLAERYPEFNDAAERIRQTAQVNALIKPVLAARDTAHWVAAFEAAGVPASALQRYPQIAQDPQLATRPVFAETEVAPGKFARIVSAAHTTADDAPTVQRPPPRLGEHTDEILTQLGLQANIAAWRQAGDI